MNSRNIAFVIMLTAVLSLMVIAMPAPLTSKEDRQKNILDYYLELPDDYFYCEIKPKNLNRDYKKKQIRKENIKSGYILARSEDYNMEVALFTDAHLGISVIAINRPCQRGCMCNLFELKQNRGGKWVNFDSFPSDDEIRKAAKLGADDEYEFALPEIGTDIKVVNPDSRKTLLLIRWSGGQFFINKK